MIDAYQLQFHGVTVRVAHV